MEQRNCKNCGAALEHSYNHKCPYCGTLFDFNIPEDKVAKINYEELFDCVLEKVYFEPQFRGFKFIFTGYIIKKPRILEYDGNRDIFSEVVDWGEPPKRAGFMFTISLKDLEQHGLDVILYKLESCGINHKEIESIMKQILENEKFGQIKRYLKYQQDL